MLEIVLNYKKNVIYVSLYVIMLREEYSVALYGK